MRVSLLDQPRSAQLADEFVQLLRSSETTRFWAASAWIRTAALRVLEPDLKAFSARVSADECRGLFGVDLGGTSREALELASTLFGATRVFHSSGNPRRTFHPKTYLFEQSDRAVLSTGSSNFTVGGLWGNFEGGVVIKLDLAEEHDRDLLAKTQEWFESYWDDPHGSRRINKATIAELEGDPEIRLPSEEEMREVLVRPSLSKGSIEKRATRVFPQRVRGLRSLPQIPRGGGRTPTPADTEPVFVPALPLKEIEAPEAESDLRVLAAGIPRDRWKQVGFNKKVTDEFFRVAENGAVLWAEAVNQAGEVGAPREAKLVFSDTNQNHRIELPEPDGRPDPRPDWGIVLVLERSFRSVRYMSLRPGDTGYAEIQQEISNRSAYGASRKSETKRVLLTYGELQAVWPGRCPLRP